jgi:hypothetical protein
MSESSVMNYSNMIFCMCSFSLTWEYFEVEQWQGRKQRAVLRSYYKELRKTTDQSSSREQTHVAISSIGVHKDR